MGNMSSYLPKVTLENSIGEIEKEELPVGHLTPSTARCNKVGNGLKHFVFDPRSPTVDIDRTPIVFEDHPDQEEEDEEGTCQMDPRSPSVGITRTPLTQCFQPMINIEAIEKEAEDLIQILNFNDTSNLDDSVVSQDLPVIQQEATPIVEDTLDFSSIILPATSTPTPSPVKASNKPRRATSTVITDENSFNSSPLKGSISSQLPRPRVPFGDVNRPLASPRLQLQNKQKEVIRSELMHQRRSVKCERE